MHSIQGIFLYHCLQLLPTMLCLIHLTSSNLVGRDVNLFYSSCHAARSGLLVSLCLSLIFCHMCKTGSISHFLKR